jgi:hypothetical protein
MSKGKTKINVQGTEIQLYTKKGEDYISLTDMAKTANERTEIVIQTWLRNRNTIEFISLWEQLNNPNFNHSKFAVIKEKVGLNNFYISPKKWVEETSAIGIESRAGRYGGTFAHKDIAMEFGTWLSPAFKLYLIKEFQVLQEQRREVLEWDVRRILTKINYQIHSTAVKSILPNRITKEQASIHYASEADLLNLALFGISARDWRRQNPEAKGNMRDHASPEQLVVLANLESINAELIREGLSQSDRLQRLNEIAIYQMQIIVRPGGRDLDPGNEPRKIK